MISVKRAYILLLVFSDQRQILLEHLYFCTSLRPQQAAKLNEIHDGEIQEDKRPEPAIENKLWVQMKDMIG
jgi:hypothetical protein